MVTGVACGLQNRYEAFTRLGWVRFPHVPAISRQAAAVALAAVAFGWWAPGEARAQDPPPSPEAAPADTLLEAEPVAIDTVPPVSPLGALARSMILPGWGQLTVGRPSRAAIYFGAETVFLYMVFKSSQKLSVAKRSLPVNDELVQARTRQRENWIVLAAFTAFMSGIDAWVSTQFWDYEPSIGPPPDGSVGVSLGFKVRVP